MTATDELRRMLDERGVEWWPSDDPCCEDIITHWCVGPFQWTAIEGEKDLWLNAGIAGHEPLTPEQAIAATLGTTDARPTQAESSGTCKLDDFADVPFSVDYKIEGYDMGSCRDYATLAECSACGAYIIVPPEYHHVLTCDGDEVYQPYRFCPCCGKKVVEPTTNDVDAEATNG